MSLGEVGMCPTEKDPASLDIVFSPGAPNLTCQYNCESGRDSSSYDAPQRKLLSVPMET